MRLRYTHSVLETIEALPVPIRKAFYKQADLLAKNLLHPSLRAKKYDEAQNRWQARVNRNWRFYFKIIGDTYIIEDVVPRPK